MDSRIKCILFLDIIGDKTAAKSIPTASYIDNFFYWIRRNVPGSVQLSIVDYHPSFAGLGGLAFVVPKSTNFSCDVSGYGFLALAVMILGQWTPSRIALASLFFGTLKTFSATYSGIPFLNTLGIAGNYYKLLPFVITIFVLILGPKGLVGPKAEGKPFEKGMS